ncbi:fructose-specific PTS transporter subunit EIIC [Streptomyces sp. NPDC001137]|uniref:fructose-specific PTS transporter subunit EIIC n=1 Tax=Streptomyces sp. NPDC001137 TaxID=3154378 RepID=UPI003317123C
MPFSGKRKRATPVSAVSARPSTKPGQGGGVRLGSWMLSGTPHLGALAVTGGLLIALGLIISGPDVASTPMNGGGWTQAATWSVLLFKTGTSVLSFLPLLIGAYLAYGVAGVPGAISGFVGGMAAMAVSTGYLGGVVAGVMAGVLTLALQRIPLPSVLRETATTVLVPLVSAACTTVAFFAFVGPQLGALAQWLDLHMGRLQFHHVVVVGLLLGLMTGFDLNGALGGAALSFGITGLSGDNPANAAPQNLTIMAAVVAARMVPPLAMTLTTVIRPALFSKAERDCGRSGWLLGAIAVPEGALAFAFADPLRVIPACMAGCATSAAMVMGLGAGTYAPFGGVLAMGRFGGLWVFSGAVLAGVVVTSLVTIGLKNLGRAAAVAEPAAGATARTRRLAKVAA